MALPRLYVCYGMPKSGSTLAFQLSRAVALRAGFDQMPLQSAQPVQDGDSKPDEFAASLAAAERAGRHLIVIKTHSGMTEALRDAVADGRALVQAHARDPRDIALSMRDAGLQGAQWGKTAEGRRISTPEDALERVRHQIRRYRHWANLPGTLCLSYERTAFSSLEAARRIAEHMQVKASPRRDVMTAKCQFTQLNKGRSQRYLTEMSADQQARWYAEFREHIETYCSPRDGSTLPGRVGTLAGRIARRLR